VRKNWFRSTVVVGAALILANCGAPAAPGEFVMVVKGCSPSTSGSCNWWNRFEIGVNDGATATGLKSSMVFFDTTGLSSSDPKIAEGQGKLVDDLVARKVSVIGIDPDDLEALEPHLQKARAAGIMVVAHEVPGMVNKDWDTETIDNTKFGEDAAKALAEAMGSTGNYMVFVGNAPLHKSWADNAVTYIKNTYPNMKLVQAAARTSPCAARPVTSRTPPAAWIAATARSPPRSPAPLRRPARWALARTRRRQLRAI